MWNERTSGKYHDRNIYGSSSHANQNKRIVFDDPGSDDDDDNNGDVSFKKRENFTDHKMGESFKSSSQSGWEKHRTTFGDDQDGDELGYSKAEMFKLKAAKSSESSKFSDQKRKHITFDDDPSDSSDHSEAETTDSEEQQEESESENSENERKVEDYSAMTMQELLRLQEDMGTRAFREKVLKVEKSSDRESATMESTFKRLNKNRPSEMPLMRKRAPRMNFLDPVPGKKTKKKLSRDPRFDDLSGTLFMNLWNERYQFLKDTRKKELEVLRKQLKKENNKVQKEKIKRTIQRMQSQMQESVKQDRELSVKQLEKKQQREALREGKKPRFMPEKEKKMLLKTMHFEQLKKDNKVNKYLERKEKRQLKRERKAPN